MSPQRLSHFVDVFEPRQLKPQSPQTTDRLLMLRVLDHKVKALQVYETFHCPQEEQESFDFLTLLHVNLLHFPDHNHGTQPHITPLVVPYHYCPALSQNIDLPFLHRTDRLYSHQ